MNSAGQFTNYYLVPNNVETKTTYNSFGFPEKIFSAGIQDLNMEFEIKNGNLKWRQDNFGHRSLKEEFSYDNLNRLLTAQITSPNILQVNDVQYNPLGTIDHKVMQVFIRIIGLTTLMP